MDKEEQSIVKIWSDSRQKLVLSLLRFYHALCLSLDAELYVCSDTLLPNAELRTMTRDVSG